MFPVITSILPSLLLKSATVIESTNAQWRNLGSWQKCAISTKHERVRKYEI